MQPLEAGIPEASASCPVAKVPSERHLCGDAAAKLLDALRLNSQEEPNVAFWELLNDQETDVRLAPLEACQEFQLGLVRALRAELRPDCADVLVAPLVGSEATRSDLHAFVRTTLVGLGIGARLRRTSRDAPVAPEAADRATLQTYFEAELFPWAAREAHAIEQLASQGSRLAGYGRAVVAIEAGMADMRYVEMVRAAPIPSDMAEDQELADVYYASLDELLEPRKARGRDAALVGLMNLSKQGVLASPRIGSARALLSRAYGGRRIDTLDALLLPSRGVVTTKDPGVQLAATLPTPYFFALTAPDDARLEHETRLAALGPGIPVTVERKILAGGNAVELHALAAAYFERGTTYIQAEAFRQAAATVEQSRNADAHESGELRLLAALASALSAAPASAVDLIARSSRFSIGEAELAQLEDLAKDTSIARSLRGAAIFDAAYLGMLSAPVGSAAHWRATATRFDTAAKLLNGRESTVAHDLAREARATAKDIAEKLE